MLGILSYIQKHFVIFIPIAMVLGLVYGYLAGASFLQVAIMPLVVFMVFFIMVGMNFRSLLSGVDFKLQLTTQLFNFLVVPFVAYFLSLLFLASQPYLALGLLLMSLLPTSGVTIVCTDFANGNVVASVKMAVIGLILGGLLAPLYVNLLMGEVINMPFLLIFKKIVYIIFIPMILAIFTQDLLIRIYGIDYFQHNIKPNFAKISTLGILGIVFVGLSMRAHYIINNPQIILWLLIPLFLFYTVNYVLGTLLAKYFFNKEDGIALVFGSAVRHLAISLALALTVFGDKGADIALIIITASILQIPFASWYSKLSHKLFKPKS